MSMISEVGTKLAVDGEGVVGTTLFEGLLPESPDNCIALFEMGGSAPVRAHRNTIIAEQPTLHLLVRNLDYETGYAKVRSVKNRLQNFTGVLSGTRYLTITARQAIHPLGTDESRRFLFSMNFDVMRQPS